MIATRTSGRKKVVQPHQNTFKIYREINDRSNLLCLKPGYIMIPTPAETFSRNFMIKDLIIRYGNTEALWRGAVDLSNLKQPLYSIVDLGSTYIEVYPNEKLKPMAGTELNKKCFVTFSNITRINRNKLKKICEQNQCQILQLDCENKKFTVEIPHFSKYAFDGALEDDKEQQKQIESMKPEQSKSYKSQQTEKNRKLGPFDQLKLIYTENLLKENLQLRSVLGGVLGQKLQKNVLPTEQLQNQVRQHNQSQGNRIGDQRIKGSPFTVGINGIVSSFTTSKKMQGMVFNAVEQTNRDNLKIVFQVIQDDSIMTQYILDRSVPFETRRVLALNVICFNFDKCRFQFIREKQKLQLGKIDRSPEEYYKPAYIKNWFEWVLNEDKKLTLPENELLRQLCLRRGSYIAEKYMNYKKEEDAEFLCSIEDQSYRTGDAPKSLSADLWAISLNNISIFEPYEWIIKLGVCLWYYSFNDSVGQKISNILLQKLESKSKYNLQRHILLTFFQLPYTKNLLSPSHRKELPLWWLISNKNNQKESFINKDNHRYTDYRFSLISQLVQDYAEYSITLKLVSYDKFLNKQQKTKILALFIKKFPEEAERIPNTNWAECSDLINQNKAYLAYSNNEYFNALQYFGKCTNISKTSLNIIKQIAHKQQLLCSCSKKVAEKSKKLLQKIPTKILDDQIHYLGVMLGTIQLTKSMTKNIINLSYSIQKIYLRQRMLEIIFECMIRSPDTLIGLKKDKQFFDFIYKIYTDTAYRLELKIVRLSRI